MREKEAELLKQRRALAEREKELTLDVERRVAVEARRLCDREVEIERARSAREAEERLRRSVDELSDAKKKLDLAAASEAALLREKRELEERDRNRAAETERKLLEETRKIREEEARRAQQNARDQATFDLEQHALREAEHRQTIDALKKNLEDLQRRVQQGSQQAQGEAQETVLRDVLAAAFDDDAIEDVPKGVQGADLLQRVRTSEGRDCGVIAWESKRTAAWSDSWLPKLRDDQRAVGAACAVLVSQKLPKDIKHFGLKDGVWVCAWSYATALGAVLRAGLCDVALAKRAAEGRGEKTLMLYEYLTGTEFRNRVSGSVEALREMEDDLETEKRTMERLWKKRERQVQRAMSNVAAFVGDLQGIVGRKLEDVPALTLDAPRALPDRSPDELPPAA
jgi:hypothetical protein